MVIQPWCICDGDNVLIRSPLFCLHPTFAVKLSEGAAPPFAPTVECRLALGENISSDGCTGKKIRGILALAHPVRL